MTPDQVSWADIGPSGQTSPAQDLAAMLGPGTPPEVVAHWDGRFRELLDQLCPPGVSLAGDVFIGIPGGAQELRTALAGAAEEALTAVGHLMDSGTSPDA